MYQSIIRDPGGPSLVRLISSTNVVNGSLLLVPANTVAIFVCNGIMSNSYGPGRYEINTGESPFFVRFRNLMTMGNPGITCQVFFINTMKDNCESGGTGDILFKENRFNISLSAKAAYTIRYVISNPYVFLSKLVGMHNNTFENEDVWPAINSMILPVIKEAVIAILSTNNIHTVQGNLSSVGETARERLSSQFQEYGIYLKAIAITAINIPEKDVKRLNEFEEKVARGRLSTDLEVDNVLRVYGDINNRTMAEVLTGSLRGPGNPIAGRNSVAGMAGTMTALPWQIAMAKMAMEQMNGGMPTPHNSGNDTNDENLATAIRPNSNASGGSPEVPPPIPVRPVSR